MPQLVKGGKHVFGWSKVGHDGHIPIPPEAFAEYNLQTGEIGILIPGSRTSGGFGLARRDTLQASPMSVLLDSCPDLAEYRIPAGTAVKCRNKTCCWVKINDNSITVPPETLAGFGITPGDNLLTVRGSGLALGFLVRGPIIGEAVRHPEIETYE